ncbi:MAG: bifunctional hydroxymethylpyrimidine kinase/phosphomethylpyrimidine kinase [bacterium]
MTNMYDFLGINTDTTPYVPPIALTIAGSDSGGGAGIQADLKTFAACKVYGTSVLTLVTAQNTRGVLALEMMPDRLVLAQYEALMNDLPPKAAKVGALGNERMIGLVSDMLTDHPVPVLVIDPVMVSKHGDPLMATSAHRVFAEKMLPLATLVTPNRFEAQALYGKTVEGPSSMKDAAKAIFDRGAKNVLVKGSHLEGVVRDYLYDGTGFIEFGADRVNSERVHGSGCTHSAAITARLALGDSLESAIEFAREFISAAIEKAPLLGGGISPVNPMHAIWNA